MLNNSWYGKWNCEKGNKEILNIIQNDISGSIVKQSFIESGYYNCVPNDSNLVDGILSFWINSPACRADYMLQIIDKDTIQGTYTQYGETTEIIYKKVSDIPENGDFYCDPPIKKVPQSDLTRVELLKTFKDYSEKQNNQNINYEFRLDEKSKAQGIIERFKLNELFQGKEDLDLVFEIFNWVCTNFKHNGQSGMPGKRDLEAVINYCDNNDGKINCRGLALILSQTLRLYGMKAAHITCMPYEEPFNDCHVVTICFSQKLNKWIMLDPTWHLYLKNNNGEIIDLKELRNILINGDNLFPNTEANYYGNPMDLNYYIEYMTKNTFRFRRSEKACYGAEDGWEGNPIHVLIPVKYLEVADKFETYEQKEFITCDDVFWGY